MIDTLRATSLAKPQRRAWQKFKQCLTNSSLTTAVKNCLNRFLTRHLLSSATMRNFKFVIRVMEWTEEKSILKIRQKAYYTKS